MPAGSEMKSTMRLAASTSSKLAGNLASTTATVEPLVDIGLAEIALRRVAEIARKLRRPRRIEAELVAKLGALRLRHRLAHDLAQGIAERALHGKGDHGDRQHDENGLASALGEEG